MCYGGDIGMVLICGRYEMARPPCEEGPYGRIIAFIQVSLLVSAQVSYLRRRLQLDDDPWHRTHAQPGRTERS